jgi:hypothetical protein
MKASHHVFNLKRDGRAQVGGGNRGRTRARALVLAGKLVFKFLQENAGPAVPVRRWSVATVLPRKPFQTEAVDYQMRPGRKRSEHVLISSVPDAVVAQLMPK